MAQAQLTIDIDAITANWHALDKLSAPTVETTAVIKANAYGLGADQVAPALLSAGARTFFVAVAKEGVALRATIGPDIPIYLFEGYMDGAADMIRNADLIPLLNSPEQVQRFQRDLPNQPCGLQFDSGMNRLGIEPVDLPALMLSLPALSPQLVMSHLACSDEPSHPMNATQMAAFTAMTAPMLGTKKSLSATGGTVLGAPFHFDITRPGVGLYGGLPFDGAAPVVTLSVPVIQTRTVLPGEIVGYGGSWIAKRPTKVATIAAGYADGLPRSLHTQPQLFADDVACPVIGRISMDLITVDVTDLREVPPTLDILCKHQTIDDLASQAGTIGYEMLTSLGARYNRVYKGG